MTDADDQYALSIIQRCREKGMTDEAIIREMMAGRAYPDVVEYAKEYAKLFNLRPANFVRIARARPIR